MKAVLFKKRNRREKLVYSDIEKPIPANDDELVIKVHASSVNAADYRLLKMGISPKTGIFGADIAGIVESVGSQVSRFKPGDEVIGDLSNAGFGGFAEFVVAPQEALALKPPRLSFEDAAALPLAGVTALQALRKGKISRGKKVLIVGSSGGVGTYALQLAKHYGADVTAVCSTRNVDQARLLGADRVIDYSKEPFWEEHGVYDIILAVNGNHPLLTYKRCLNQDGICVFTGGSLGQIFKSIFFGKLLSMGSKKMRVLSAKATAADLAMIAEIAESGGISPTIEVVYPLSETAHAMQYVMAGHARGKVVIKNRN